jgi:Flp pilus assembly protein TadD
MSVRWALLILIPVLHLAAECGAPEVFTKVDGLLQNRQYEEAAKALDGLKHCRALSPIERFESGWLYGRARHFGAALEAFNAVPENVPDILTHNYAVALSKFELADYRGASEVLKRFRSQPGFDAKSANLLAVSYSKLGLYQDAYVVLAQDIHDHPDDLSAYLNMATVCAEGGDFAKAAAVASEATRLFPQSDEVLVVQGAANTLLGHLDEARKNFSAAAGIAPHAAEPRFFQALTEYKLGQYAGAVSILQSAIDAGIADSDLHYLLAESLLRLDPVDRPRVIAQLNRAIELNSNSVSARTLRGKLLLDAGQEKEAIVDLQLANRLDATSRSAAYNLARAYRAQGRTAASQALFDRLRSETGDTLTELGDKRLNQALTHSSTDKAQ